ncbi:MAG TPA: colicin V production CvpA [Gammaproteobacteria bacterium]|nr:colicin V production CvpA [Gammaproteobacteria bacterium]
MNWVDFVIIGIIAISVIVSFFRGFLREALSLLVWGLAIYFSLTYYSTLEPLLPSGYGLPSTVRLVLSGIAILLGVLIVGGIFTWIIGTLFDKTGMSGTDRVAGILFGGLRGVILVVIVVLIISFLPFKDEPWWTQSKIVPHFTEMAEWVKVRLPGEIPAYFEQYIEKKEDAKPVNEKAPVTTPDAAVAPAEKMTPAAPDPVTAPPLSTPAPVIPQESSAAESAGT